MNHLLYSELLPWYGLIDPCEEHRDEAASYQTALLTAVVGDAGSLLELGAGAGNNAFHMKARFQATLVDLSEGMLALSREQNPECIHVVGDMRTVRLARAFDAVLVHDAIMYMTSEQDLLRAMQTAFVHTRPGGAAVFAPDCTTETFADASEVIEGSDASRSLRGLEWTWDPDPKDETSRVEYAFLLREGSSMRAVHDTHIEGLFTKQKWIQLLTSVGYGVDVFGRPRDDEGNVDEVFICRRPHV